MQNFPGFDVQNSDSLTKGEIYSKWQPDLTQSAKGVPISTVNFRKLAPPCISPSKYKPDKIVTQKTLR